LLGLNVVIGV